MQILAAAKRFADKYYYQLDSLKLSTDQKQYFNRARGNIALKLATLTYTHAQNYQNYTPH